MKKTTHARAVFTVGFIMLMTSFCCNGEETLKKYSGANMAFGKPYVLTPEPNYKLCRDDEDSRQLTDGVVYSGSNALWTQKGTVGWDSARYAVVTVDLGKMEPIDGVRFHSAFDGPHNVQWPSSIGAYVSEDGKDYVFVKELVDPAWKSDGLPPEFSPWEGQHKISYWYGAEGLATKGRFVRFVARGPSPYLFCDEVEVIRGTDDLLKAPPKGYRVANHLPAYLAVYPYLAQDMAGVRKNAARLSEEQKRTVEKRLAEVESQMADIKMDEFQVPGYRAVAPLNAVHRKIFEINGEALRLRRAPSLIVWHKHRWDPLEATEVPENILPAKWWQRVFSFAGLSGSLSGELPVLGIELMDNEYRSEVLNLTNTRQNEQEINISFQNFPGGKLPPYIRIHQVEYVATAQGKMIADALPEAEKNDNGYKIRIPSGMTRQVWFGVHPEGIKPGVYRAAIIVAPKGCRMQRKVAFNLTVAPFRFPDHPRLSLWTWDYTDKPYGFNCMTDANVKLAIEDMKAHFVDRPYGHPQSACYPDKNAFDADGNLIGPLRTEGFDEWVSNWKDARYYALYLGNDLPDFVANEPLGSDRFNQKIAQWAAAFGKYADKKGIAPERIVLHLFDEPLNAEQYRLNTLWGKAIKQGCPRFKLFTDVRGERSGWDSPELDEMLQVHDIICPHLPSCGIVPDKVKAMVQGNAKQFSLYSCEGPARMFDPYYYHLLQAWHCRQNNAVGMGFWNYWDYYKTPMASAWNEVVASDVSFGMVYTDKDSVTSGKHWEAVREGVEDYEYLDILRDRIEEVKKSGQESDVIREAEAFLRDAPERVAGDYDKGKMSWSIEKDRTMADTARLQILRLLQKLKQ